MNEPNRPPGRSRRQPSPEEAPTTKRRPGRPRKNPVTQTEENQGQPRKRGRPRKAVPSAHNPNESQSRETVRNLPKRRGRPRKTVPNPPPEDDEDFIDNDEQVDDDEELSQVDEEPETLTRRTRRKATTRRLTRRELALRDHDERLDNALEREKTRLKAPHSFMTKEVYEAPGKPGYAGPDPAFDNHWDDDDEASLIETYWRGTPLEYITSSPDFISYPKTLLVFKASLHVFKIDPLTLFTMGLNDIVFDNGSKSTKMIEDDRRPLHTDDLLLLEKLYCKMEQDPTLSYPEIHAKQQRTTTLRGGVSSPQAQLLSEIATIATRSGECPSDKYYHVVLNDLNNVIHGLGTLRLTWEHDCEFFFQSISDSLSRELYPTSKEMPALYKNCYLSVERKKLYDFKVHGHDLVYFEEHHLRMPSMIPQKLHSSPVEEELEAEVQPEPLPQSGTQPDEDPFNETAPEVAAEVAAERALEAAAVDEDVNIDSHDNNPQVLIPSDYQDFGDYGGNSDLDPAEEEPAAHLSPMPEDIFERDETPQESPAASPVLHPIARSNRGSPTLTARETPEEHQTMELHNRLETSPAASPSQAHLAQHELRSPTPTSQVNPRTAVEPTSFELFSFAKKMELRNRSDTSPAASLSQAFFLRRRPCSVSSASQGSAVEDGVPRNITPSAMNSQYGTQDRRSEVVKQSRFPNAHLSFMGDRPHVEEEVSPAFTPQDMFEHLRNRKKRKSAGDSPRPTKVLRKEEDPLYGVKPPLTKPGSTITDMLSSIDEEGSQPVESGHDSSGQIIWPSRLTAALRPSKPLKFKLRISAVGPVAGPVTDPEAGLAPCLADSDFYPDLDLHLRDQLLPRQLQNLPHMAIS
ncbi:hypothetical protein FAVG1_04860 [Fusarium avenaceum]|nr:hypothetical protein FAVG1_04860 [Fusarium avenaceum]